MQTPQDPEEGDWAHQMGDGYDEPDSLTELDKVQIRALLIYVVAPTAVVSFILGLLVAWIA